MRSWKAGALVLGVLALGGIAGLGAVARPDVARAQAPQTWTVQVGGDVFEDDIFSQRYYPNPIAINAGDSVRFDFVSFHTVTFLGGRPMPPLAVPGTAAGSLNVNPQVFFSSLPPGQTSATYDGSQYVNLIPDEPEGPPDPSAPAPAFSVTFTRAGTFAYFCILHPGMRGEIVVEPAGAALPETAAAARARGQAEYDMTIAATRATVQAAAMSQPTTGVAPGRAAAHSVLNGIGSGYSASVIAYLPRSVNVRRGDLVTWTMADPFELHTVTFAGSGPPPAFVTPDFGPGGPGSGPPTLVITADVANQVGGGTFTGSGYFNSGLMSIGQSYSLQIDAPAGTYEYFCIIHPFQRGTITVTE